MIDDLQTLHSQGADIFRVLLVHVLQQGAMNVRASSHVVGSTPNAQLWSLRALQTVLGPVRTCRPACRQVCDCARWPRWRASFAG